MTGNENPPARDTSTSGASGAPDARAEQVLSQALRLMAGGGTDQERRAGASSSAGRRLTTAQLVLLAAIAGLLIGMVAGFLSLL